MIGDRWKDVRAGINAGCKTIFINNNYKESKQVDANFTADTLLDAVYIIEKSVI